MGKDSGGSGSVDGLDIVTRVVGEVEVFGGVVVEGEGMLGFEVMASCACDSDRNAVKEKILAKDWKAKLLLAMPFCLPPSLIFTLRGKLLHVRPLCADCL